MVPLTISELEATAREIRREVIEILYNSGSGHPGGSLSTTDIFVALFFGNILKFDPRDPKNEKRDRLLLSCGHICPAYYTILAKLGVFNETLLNSLRDFGSPLQGHPSLVHAEFVESSSGSLGQGLSIGAGKALSLKAKGEKEKVVVLSSDGEQNEGSLWEAVMFAAHHRLDNLNLIIDQNEMQLSGRTSEILDTEPLVDKYHSFGWEVYQTNGHDFRELLANFCNFNERKGKPKVAICRTIRGKGVSFMENEERYHACTLSEDEYRRAMEELS